MLLAWLPSSRREASPIKRKRARRGRASAYVLAAGVALTLAATGSVSVQARDLTFEDRVKAQEAIERVYYSHQIGATKPFEDAVPRTVLETKVRKYLRQSAALKEFWKSPVTAEMLRRETERMARQTRSPNRLSELYAALDSDPFLVQECLARRILVDRLIRNFFAYDPRFHETRKAHAQELHHLLLAGELDPSGVHPDLTVTHVIESDEIGVPTKGRGRPGRVELSPEEFRKWRLRFPEKVGVVSSLMEERGAFVVGVVLDETNHEFRVANYVVAKVNWDTWWEGIKENLEGEWIAPVSSELAPLSGLPTRPNGTAEAFDSVINGATGGQTPTSPSCSGDDTWDNGVLDNLPDPRRSHAAVWTGNEMVVWGGRVDATGYGLNTGGRYDPATDTWSPTSYHRRAVGATGPRGGLDGQ